MDWASIVELLTDRRRQAMAATALIVFTATLVFLLRPTPSGIGTTGLVPSSTSPADYASGIGDAVNGLPQPGDAAPVAGIGSAVTAPPIAGIGEAVEPRPGGTTHSVANHEQWQAAVAAAQPGDVIRLTQSISEPLIYRGDNDGGTRSGADGTAEAPIVITADPDVWIDGGGVRNTRNHAGLNLWYVDHVHAVGLSVRNAQYGIRCLQCHGSAERPLRIAGNTIESVGYVGIAVGGHLSTHSPSSNILVEYNRVSQTGKLTPRFGEGIYVGHGITEWVDETSNVTVRGNDVSFTTAEGIDVKPGTREIIVEHNLIHDVAPIDGGAISAHYVSVGSNPKPDELDRVIVRSNLIWNHNLNGAPSASDAAIWVGHGGVEITDNTMWGFRRHQNTRAVRVRSPQPFGPHRITIARNTFWLERGWVADGNPGPSVVESYGNRGAPGTNAEATITEGDLVGPVPPIGSAGDADAGLGPGSAFLTPDQYAAAEASRN